MEGKVDELEDKLEALTITDQDSDSFGKLLKQVGIKGVTKNQLKKLVPKDEFKCIECNHYYANFNTLQKHMKEKTRIWSRTIT